MGRALEFALATVIIYIISILSACFVAVVVGSSTTKYFDIIIDALDKCPK